MLSILLFLLSSLSCLATANNIPSSKTRVRDIIIDNVPLLNQTYLSDFLTLLPVLYMISILPVEQFPEFFTVMSVVQLSRCLCMASTILPPLKDYHDKYRLGGINGTGTEYIFSGHASYSALIFIYMCLYTGIPVYVLIIYNLISQGCIIVSRNHYTVDIVLAWIITPLIWGNLRFCRGDERCWSWLRILY